MTNEALALQFSNNRKQLKNRLNEALQALKPEVRDTFGKGTFDFENKRLIGENGIVLQWQVRKHPDLKPDYNNPQISRGFVRVILPPKSKTA